MLQPIVSYDCNGTGYAMDFCHFFYKGHNFYDFLFAFQLTVPMKRGLN